MARTVMLQFCVAFVAAIVVAAIAALIGSVGAVKTVGISALLGGLCSAVPNALFALSLYASTKKPGGATPTTFFVGEFIKLLTTIALLASVVLLYSDLHWLAFLGGFIAVLKSYFISLLRR